jgi:hypothetical protein
MTYKTEQELQEELIRLQLAKLNKAEKQFIPFVKTVWPEFVEGPHHIKIAKQFERIATGEIKRLIVNMPPRHTKSEFASYLFPAWMVGRNPKLKVIQTTHTGELAVRFGRKMKTLLTPKSIARSFMTSELNQILKLPVVGKRTTVANTMLPVLVVRLQVVVRIF